MEAARRHGWRRGPRDRTRQGPVDLHRRRVASEATHPAHDPVGQVGLVEQAAVEHRRRHVGHDRTAYDDPLAVTQADSDHATVLDLDPGHRCRDAHRAPRGLEAPGERVAEPPRPAHRDRETQGLGHHRHDQSEAARAGRLQGDVGVPGAAGDQGARGVAAEPVRAELGSGGEQLADPGQHVTASQRPHHPGSVAQRREGSQQRAQQRRTDPVPPGAQLQPRLAVAGVHPVVLRRRVVTIAQHHRPPTVGEGVAQRRRWVAPAQAVTLEVQGTQHGGGRGEGVERAEGVVHEAVDELAVAAHRTAHLVLLLGQQHRPPGVGQQVGGHQTVRAGTDDHGVVGRAHRAARRPFLGAAAPDGLTTGSPGTCRRR